MSLKICTKCGTAMIPKQDGLCPSCGNIFLSNTNQVSEIEEENIKKVKPFIPIIAGLLLIIAGVFFAGLTTGDFTNPSLIGVAVSIIVWVSAYYTFSHKKYNLLIKLITVSIVLSIALTIIASFVGSFPGGSLFCGLVGLILVLLSLSLIRISKGNFVQSIYK